MPTKDKITSKRCYVHTSQHVFFWRFVQLFRTYRGNTEFVHWIGKFEIATKRLINAWRDLHEPPDLPAANTTAFVNLLTPAAQAEIQNVADINIADRATRAFEMRDQMLEGAKTGHRNTFPLNDDFQPLQNYSFLRASKK